MSSPNNKHRKQNRAFLSAQPLSPLCLAYHHQILLLLVEHRTSMKSFQALQSPAIPLTSFHDLLVLHISSSIVLRHVLLSLPLLLYPWRFQSNAVFSIAPVSLCNMCPVQFHFLLFIWFSINFWWVILHSSLFVTYIWTSRPCLGIQWFRYPQIACLTCEADLWANERKEP